MIGRERVACPLTIPTSLMGHNAIGVDRVAGEPCDPGDVFVVCTRCTTELVASATSTVTGPYDSQFVPIDVCRPSWPSNMWTLRSSTSFILELKKNFPQLMSAASQVRSAR